MALDLRCGDVHPVSRRRCQKLAGHEFDHGAVLPGTTRRVFSFWSVVGPGVESTDPLLGAGHSWAPGFPRVEAVALVPVASVAAARAVKSEPVVSGNGAAA